MAWEGGGPVQDQADYVSAFMSLPETVQCRMLMHLFAAIERGDPAAGLKIMRAAGGESVLAELFAQGVKRDWLLGQAVEVKAFEEHGGSMKKSGRCRATRNRCEVFCLSARSGRVLVRYSNVFSRLQQLGLSPDLLPDQVG